MTMERNGRGRGRGRVRGTGCGGKQRGRESQREQERSIGIVLGTSYCYVAVWQPKHNMAEIIINELGNRTTPSTIAFTSLERLIRDDAKFRIAKNPLNTIFDAERLIRRPFSDTHMQDDMKFFPFTIVQGKDDEPLIQVSYKGETKFFAPKEISSMLPMKMKRISEKYLKCEVKKVAITIPSYFNDAQKRAMQNAGKIAGLDLM